MSISCERPSRNLIKNSVYSLIYSADSTFESSIITVLPKLPTYEDDQRIKATPIRLGNMFPCLSPPRSKMIHMQVLCHRFSPGFPQDIEPNLPWKRAGDQQMVDRFGRLIAEHTSIIILEAMLLPTSCSPATFMQHKPDKKFTLGESVTWKVWNFQAQSAPEK